MLTIGEFSRLGRISARMLRYYDAIGLLRPEYVAENGYRFYDQRQLADLQRIRRLNDYGFPLSQISELLTLPEAQLAQRIHRRRMDAYGELNRQRALLRQMEADILRMEDKTIMQENYHVILMEDPAQKVFSVRRTIDVGQFHELFQQLRRQMEERGLKLAGPTQSLYHGQEFSYEQMDVEAQAVVAQDGPDIREKPAQLCACVVHQGPYDEIRYAYDALTAWLAQNPDYQVCGPAIERYLKDERSVSSPEELETGALFPVRKQ